MARSSVPLKGRRAIRERLRKLVLDRYGGWREFEEKFDVPHTTRVGWTRGRNPSVPDTPFLLKLAQARVNLNWLLIGEGPELWERPAESSGRQVMMAIEAELESSERAPYDEFDTAWRMTIWDEGGKPPEEVALALAVEGLRPKLQENLRLLRVYAGLMEIRELMRRSIAGRKQPDVEQLQNLLQRLENVIDLHNDLDDSSR